MSKIVFRYRGLDQQGAETRGTVEALDKEDALKKLRSLEAAGLCDLSIEGVQQLNGNAPPSPSAEPSRRFCGSCGAENPVTHSFCSSCGKPLGDAAQGQPAAQTAQGTQWPSPSPKPWQRAVELADRAEAMRTEQVLQKYLRKGYIIAYKDEERVQLVKKKQFSFLWAFLGLCFFGFGLLVYLLYYLAKSDQVVTIRLKEGRGR